MANEIKINGEDNESIAELRKALNYKRKDIGSLPTVSDDWDISIALWKITIEKRNTLDNQIKEHGK